MKRVSKIAKWLNDRGYGIVPDGYVRRSHYDNFHLGEHYFVSVYKVTNGANISVKDTGKPRYAVNGIIVGFSQEQFIRETERLGMFPNRLQEAGANGD